MIADIPPRASLRRGQTPQAFRAGTLRRAYAAADQDPDFTATDDCSVVLRYTPDVPIWVVTGEERNMKVTDPIDVYLADKLFQLTSEDLPASRTEDGYREVLAGKTMVVFGGSYGIGADMAEFARAHGADVFTFSRSSTNTQVERREDIRQAAADVHGRDRAGRLRGQHRRRAAPRPAHRDHRGDGLGGHRDQLRRAGADRPGVLPAPARRPAAASSTSPSSSYTRGRSGYSLYSSAKAAVVNLTQALADEWSGEGVKVNCVNPERTATPDAHQGLRRRAGGLAAGLDRGGPALRSTS